MTSLCVSRRVQLFVRNSFAGGFISDSAAYVATRCEECQLGAFINLEKYPGTRHRQCRACPRGKCHRLYCYGVKTSFRVAFQEFDNVKTSSMFSVENAQETLTLSLLYTLLR